MKHKAGFVNIIGRPNVGKSTLMNRFVGERISIVTSKAQTTRHRILGIVSGEDYQVVFSDLPGLLKPHYKLQEKMMKFVENALADADVLLVMTEPGAPPIDSDILEKILKSNTPVIGVINKVDLSDQINVQKQIAEMTALLNDAPVVPVSAINGFNLQSLFSMILEKLPESPPYYPKDELTDRNLRFIVAEIIREKILLQYRKEIPYSVEVVVDDYKESETLDKIHANIYVARESQKMIILGKGGQAIKKLGTSARMDIEKFLDKKVYLELTVKVLKDWRDSEKILKRLGYDPS